MLRLTTILLVVACTLAAAPLMAHSINDAKSSEARAALGTIKDRLRVLYIQNNNVLNPNWTLADLVQPEELDGLAYDRSDYGYFVRSVDPPKVCAYCLADKQTGAPTLIMEIANLATGAATLSNTRDLPADVRGFWSGTPELTAARDARIAARQREALMQDLLAWAATFGPLAFFMLPAALLLLIWRRNIRAAKLAGALAAMGLIMEFWISSRPPSGDAAWVAIATVVAFVLLFGALLRTIRFHPINDGTSSAGKQNEHDDQDSQNEF